MELHEAADKLYVSMKEGIIFVFDVSEIEPIVLNTIKPAYEVTQMSMEPATNSLLALDIKGTLISL